MKIILKRQAEKYLENAPIDVQEKLLKAIEDIKEFRGDIKKLADGSRRYKIYHYRIIFTADRQKEEITITEINTRGNIKY